MVISRIKLTNFRNLKSFSVDPGTQLNLLQGGNGSGKTGVLEAICLIARGHSFRAGPLGSLLNIESEVMAVHLDVLDAQRTSLRLSGIKRGGEALLVKVDGVNQKRGSVASRFLPVQVVTPDESNLIFSGPSIRRSFLDWGLFHVEPGYLELARKYKKTLRQRNAWIRGVNRGTDPWLEELATLAARINGKRKSYLERIDGLLRKDLGRFGVLSRVRMEYYGGGLGVDASDALEGLRDRTFHDRQAGATGLGPHRGDVKVTINGAPAKTYLSRGQAKLVSVLFALSQSKLLLNDRSMKSILLIDDISAELDEDNLLQCMELVSSAKMQVFVTSSSSLFSAIVERPFEECKTFHVKHGQLI